MDRKNLTIVLLTALVLLLGGWTGLGQKQKPEPKPPRPVWEYKVLKVVSPSIYGTDVYETKLNELGAQGWEVISEHQAEGTSSIRYTLRRAK